MRLFQGRPDAAPQQRFEALHGNRQRSIQHPHQRSMAHLLRVERRRGKTHHQITDYHQEDHHVTNPIHPAEILADELKEFGMSALTEPHLARSNQTHCPDFSRAAGGDADTALRLSQLMTPLNSGSICKRAELPRAGKS